MQDPVCGMTVEPHTAAGTQTYNEITYAFCSVHCLEKFRADPAQYVAPSHDTHVSVPRAGTVYTCPMHPEVRQEGPGACPRCGMALEPVTAVVPHTRTTYVCPMHPEIVRSEPGTCPHLWDGPRTTDRESGRGSESRTGRHDPPVLDQSAPHGATLGAGDVRDASRPAGAACALRASPHLDPVGLRDAGRALGWLAVLYARVGLPRQPQPEHVHAHRHRHRHCLHLQRDRDARAWSLSGFLPHAWR